MSEPTKPQPGTIVWRDLTVPDAAPIRDFYASVVGWETTPHDMGDYHDYNVHLPGTDSIVTGICHARGTNASIPPVWMTYVAVDSVQESAARCRELGGEVLDGPRPMGKSQFCVIKDPAGAILGLIEA